ncbi:MAG: secondary thiamine-phosphate synthase enzyme YjbQ [Pseudomonadota bacterium]
MPNLLEFKTNGRGPQNITDTVADALASMRMRSGILHLFIQHTSASLTIQENADPDVLHDLAAWLDRLAPEDGSYTHVAEGPDDMPAHLKSVLTCTSLSIPFADGKLLLGTWQGIYLLEHRRAPHRRKIVMMLTPEI